VRNVLIPPKKPSLIVKLIKEVCGGLNMLLWACAILCIISYLFQFVLTPDNIAPDNVSCDEQIFLVHVSNFVSYYALNTDTHGPFP